MEETCTSSVGVSLSHPLLLGAVLSLLVEVFSICLVTQSSVNLLFTCGWALGERCSQRFLAALSKVSRSVMASGTRALPSQPTRTDEESAGWVKARVVAPKHPFDALLGASAAQGPGSRFCCLPRDAKLLLWKPTESRGCSGSPWLSLFPCLLTSASPAPCHFCRSSRPRAFSVFTEYFAFVFKRLERLQSKHC